MRHVVLDEWSRGTSGLHRRDPRAKVAAVFVLLVTVATAWRGVPALAAILIALLAAAFAAARIPTASALLRACVVLSFTIPFALFSLLAGEPARAGALVLKSYVSALAVLLLVATTPMAVLLRGLESAGVPRFLLMVAQFVYRYLFVIAEEARSMRDAALSRGAARARPWAPGAGFRAAAGAVGALFARSYARADAVQRAMLARGFTGRFPSLARLRFTAIDAAFVLAAAACVVLARVAAERLAG